MKLKNIYTTINPLLDDLNNHSLYKKVDSLDKLRVFMQEHVFAVLDFMSLLNAMRSSINPINNFWSPPSNNQVARFINEIVLGEESDEFQNEFISHFDLYLKAMEEVGANTSIVREFVTCARDLGALQALDRFQLHHGTYQFTKANYEVCQRAYIPEIASYFCFGRETAIPAMFQRILDQFQITQDQAPAFYHYIKRHIEVDGDEHGPMSENLLIHVCADDPYRWKVAEKAAIQSLEARIQFWDSIEFLISSTTLESSNVDVSPIC